LRAEIGLDEASEAQIAEDNLKRAEEEETKDDGAKGVYMAPEAKLEEQDTADIDEWVHKSKNKDKGKKKTEKNKGGKHQEKLIKQMNDDWR
jgi:hypothetical protein